MDADSTVQKTLDGQTPAGAPAMQVAADEKPIPPPPAARSRRRRVRPALLMGAAAALVGLAALAASAWTYGEMRREILRVSTELAQLRLSIDLYAQRGATETPALAELENRLAILEENWRNAPPGAATGQPASLPPVSGPAATAASDGDCLPSGMRLLVAAGDSYPVCGTEVTIEVTNVSNGYISLADGTTVPSGGAVPLNGTACMIGVTSGGDEGTTGFAEIRVSC